MHYYKKKYMIYKKKYVNLLKSKNSIEIDYIQQYFNDPQNIYKILLLFEFFILLIYIINLSVR
jgi:hypothetical protein